jgi:hypothetical protein
MPTRTNEKVNRLQPAYWLSAAMIPLLMVAAIAGLFFPSLYRDGPIVTSTDRGTDLATLVIYVPTLVVSLILARRGSHRAQIVWIGIVGWITYNYVVYAFAVRFNPLFLVYVALVSLSVFTLAIVLRRYDPDAVASYIKPSLPVKVISVFLALTAALFLLLWTSDILIATFGHPAPKEIPAGNAVEVNDLAVAIPLLVLAAVRLWQRRATGYALAGVMLTVGGATLLALIPGVFFRGFSVEVLMYLAFGLACVALLGVFLANVRPTHGEEVERGRAPVRA